jgi:NAD(P)H-dependent FMN reductase
MSDPRILVFAGSIRSESFDAPLAALAAKELAQSGAAVTPISLAEYPMLVYAGDGEACAGQRRPAEGVCAKAY